MLRSKIVTVAVLAMLLAGGAAHWVLFLNRGDLSFKIHDWRQEYVYYSVIRQAVASARIPFHISMRFHQTDRFMAIPDTNSWPQVLLLPLMDTGSFVVLDLLVFYVLGFLGCLLLRRKFGLSLLSFSALFLLFNFNGHITAQIAVGHSAWSGYFLLPFLILLVLELLEGKSSRAMPLMIGFVLFAMVLKGSFHLYVWCLMLLGLFLIFNWRHARTIALSVAVSAVMSLFKLLPAAYTLFGKKEKFIWSYPSLRDLIDAMVTIRLDLPERLLPWGTPGWWEYDMYLGVLGLGLVAIFGVWLRFSRSEDLKDVKYPGLDLPLLGMTLLSISYFHAFITRLPIPLLRGERVASRFIIVPIVFLIVLASVRLDRVLKRVGRSLKLTLAGIGILALMALAFVDHSFLWSVGRLQRTARIQEVPKLPGITVRPDGTYKGLVVFSMAVSACAVAAFAYLAIRNARRRRA
jgi:hypothetical protein